MTPRTETVVVSTLLSDPPPPVVTGPVAESLVRALHLVDRPRDVKAERDYADSVAAGYVTLPAGCSIPTPLPSADELNTVWSELQAHPLDRARFRALFSGGAK
ncbi:hypothetical protein PV405_29990 [Streptomyces sp. ME02-6979-3A]|uniref:hypothetical protein n=1 Tax=Streptomyces sp. ME02-6979-3A TaxID=3028673 RepID=UPI0029BE22F6|nr:hypothetical protein [Streptomyces sp. ME02-6979-3A]MDX3328844.1 hypothetical protein [Streptomyces sp. ME02-6979-3A]